MITPNSSFLGIKFVNLTKTGNVAASENETQLLQPPKGQIYKLKSLFFSILDPAGSSSGDHRFEVQLENSITTRNYIYLNSAFGNYIEISSNGFYGTASEWPAATTDQLNLMRGGSIMASNAEPLEIKYSNNTDVVQSAERKLECFVEIYKEVL